MAETVNGLYKAEVIEHEGPWRGKNDVEYATLKWVHWFNPLCQGSCPLFRFLYNLQVGRIG